jgi:hypothetical protein
MSKLRSRLSGLNTRNFFSQVVETGNLRTGCQHVPVLVAAHNTLLAGSLLERQRARDRDTGTDLWLFLNGCQSHPEDPTFMTSSPPHYLPQASPPNTIALGARASPHEFVGQTQPLAVLVCDQPS